MKRFLLIAATCLATVLVSQVASSQPSTPLSEDQVLQGIAASPDVLPIGSVVSSLLTEAQFQRLTGPGWVLADGRNIANTLFGRLTNTSTVPDLRGMFLRGQNNNRNDGRQNPELKQLGEFQADAIGDHSHSVLTPGGRDGNRSGRQDAWYAGGQGGTGACCGPETRPRNITVNYFIRVN